MSNIDRYNKWRNTRDEVFERGEDSKTRMANKEELEGAGRSNERVASIEGDWSYDEVTFPQTADYYREYFKTAPVGKWRTDDERWLPPAGYGLLVLPDHTGVISSNDDGATVRFTWREKEEMTIECRMVGGEWEEVRYDFDTYRDENEKEFVFLYDTAHNYSFWGIAHHRPLLLSRTINPVGTNKDTL